MNFPNLFPDTLCLPFYLLYTLRPLWHVLCYYVGFHLCLAEDSQLSEEVSGAWARFRLWAPWRHEVLDQGNRLDPTQTFDMDVYNRAVEFEPQFKALKQKRLPNLKAEMKATLCANYGTTETLATELISFWDFDGVSISWMRDDLRETMKICTGIRERREKYAKFLVTLKLTSLVVAMAAIFTQYTSQMSDSNSAWQNYQKFVVAMLYVPSLPIGGLMWQLYMGLKVHNGGVVKDWHSRTGVRLSAIGSFDLSCAIHMFCAIVLQLGAFFTHYVPGLLLLAVFPFLVAALLSLCLCERTDTLKFAVVCFFAADVILAASAVSSVMFFSGHSWLQSFSQTATASYCSSTQWVVFDIAAFSWKEWAVLFGWLL